MKPLASLFTKILAWFFLNLLLLAAVLAVFFIYQPYVNLGAIYGWQGTNRLRTAGMLVVHDLNRAQREAWPGILARHATIHGVDFALMLRDGTAYSSSNDEIPQPVVAKAGGVLRFRPPKELFPAPPEVGGPRKPPTDRQMIAPPGRPPDGASAGEPPRESFARKPPRPPDSHKKGPFLMMRTREPARYWAGAMVFLHPGSRHRALPAVLLAVSDSITGHGFFFDPLPWMAVAAAVILISMLFWIPMVRHITRPLTRMNRAAEKIARGDFDVVIREARRDEIGRLGKTINHMTTRLSAFVRGQKRFLGDVAHELGSPVARIQFGLGALEQRIDKENRQRVSDVMEDVDHLSKLVNELLAFSRAEMKAETVELERIDLLPVIEAAVKRESRPGDRVAVRVDPGLRVHASAELLTRALANLVRNAVKYAGDSGKIEVNARKRNGRVAIEVRDNGPGVSEDLLDQLFEPFFRPEVSRDRDSGGVGLGLTIVKTCVETCEGSVSAANLQPEGFAVTIILKT